MGQGSWLPASRAVSDPAELAKYGLVPTDEVPYYFDIDIDVEQA